MKAGPLLLLAAFTFVVARPVHAGPQTKPSVSEVAGRLQARYEKVRDFSADFTHVYEGGVLGRRVTERSDVPADEGAATPALFLSGKGNILRDFDASFADMVSVPADTWALKLVPKRRDPEYEWLVLVVDRQSFAIRMLVSVDSQGGESTFIFSDLKENVGLSDKQFNFTIPRGVEVVTQPKR